MAALRRSAGDGSGGRRSAQRRTAIGGGDFLRSGFTPANRRRRLAAARGGRGACGRGKAGARARVWLIRGRGRESGVGATRTPKHTGVGLRRSPGRVRSSSSQMGSVAGSWPGWRVGPGRLGCWAAACGAVVDRAEEMRGHRRTSADGLKGKKMSRPGSRRGPSILAMLG
jgi:hypothetical protein